MIRSPILAVAILPLTSLSLEAENWPSWRGPRRDGTSAESVATSWSPGKNVRWRLALPGASGATPVIWGERIFLTSVEGKDLVLICVSTEGKQLWKQVVSTGNRNVRGDEGNYASPSPCTDGEHVWSFMADGALACYDLDGHEKWSTNLQERYGKFQIQFGLSSTPVLDGDRLYFQLIHGKWSKTPSRGQVVALDKTTGKEVWRQVRSTDAIDECKHSYASPILYRDGKHEFLVTHGADWVIAHRLKDGKELWRCGNLNVKSNYNNTLRFVASPVAAEGMIVVPTAKGRKVVALDPGGKGDVSRSIRWELPRDTPDVPSPLVRDGIAYLCRENGVLMALDAKSGDRIYQERAVPDRYRASPVWADGRVYLTARKGKITVVKAGREFEILATNDLGEGMSASPAISNGVLYLRTQKALWAIAEQSSE